MVDSEYGPMKKFALISTTALLTGLAYSAECNDTTTPAQQDNDNCCNSAGCDECWLNVETITVEAENGDPIAQYTIAWITDNGTNNVPQDPEKAKEWYAKALPGLEKAAADGDPSACCALANMYANGKGVEKNPEKAKELMARCKELMKAQKEAKDATPNAQ